ncbi:hypothetical protein Tco_1231481 [Tanacetum coccineum]
MFDGYFNPPTIVVPPVQEVVAPQTEELADSLMLISINQDAPSTNSPTTPTFHDDPLNESPIEESTSQGSSSNVIKLHTPSEHTSKWTKYYPLENIISELGRPVSTRL